MKRILLALMLVACVSAISPADEKQVIPTGKEVPFGRCLFVAVQGMPVPNGGPCFVVANGALTITETDVRGLVQSGAWTIGNFFADSCEIPELPDSRKAGRDCARGRFLRDNASRIVLPEFGDSVPKDAAGTAFCGSSIDAQTEVGPIGGAYEIKTAGRGGCTDAMIIAPKWPADLL